MKQKQHQIEVETDGEGLYAITDDVHGFVSDSGIATGQLTAFCRHTSASLVVQECASPDVRMDLAEFVSRLAPHDMGWIRHRLEGSDDMPAHIRAALTDTSLAIPVAEGRMVLGTWQGLFLFEHRIAPHRRKVFLHLLGE